jgi:hypothetical protein
MRRLAPVLLGALGVCGCAGSSVERTDPPPVGPPHVVTGEVRTPDARNPLMRADGVWRCETDGRIELRVSADGLASLSRGGGILASVTTRRALVNRSCTPLRGIALRAPRGARVAGPGRVRCRVPRAVVLDLRHGDLVVRQPRHGRFVAGAAVSLDHIAVAAYWVPPCSYAG